MSLGIFSVLNLLLFSWDAANPFTKLSLDNVHFDYRGTENDVQHLSREPNIVLLGSSLSLYPQWRVDQADGANTVDSNHYHFARSLDRELGSRNFNATTYNLAVGGAMLSDSYLLLKHYLQKHKAPEFVIVDVAPRSFYDGGIALPDTTPIFHELFDWRDFFTNGRKYVASLGSMLNYVADRSCFLFAHRQFLSEQLVHTALHPSEFPKFGLVSWPQRATASTVKTVVSSTELADTPEKLKRSLLDYQARYSFINLYQMQKQLDFLALLEDLCCKQKIKLIVVNMPLSKPNQALLPRGFYSDFKNAIKLLVGQKALFADLGTDWNLALYNDSVHLNDKGGAVLNRKLADLILSY